MPPPKFAPIKKRKSKRTVDFGRTKSAPVTPERSPVKEVILEAGEENVSDSDSEYGFGDKWGPGERRVSHAQSNENSPFLVPMKIFVSDREKYFLPAFVPKYLCNLP